MEGKSRPRAGFFLLRSTLSRFRPGLSCRPIIRAFKSRFRDADQQIGAPARAEAAS
jgi:hypothetical protein